MDIHDILNQCEGFQWDEGNSLKNWLKHGIAQKEAEEVFVNDPLLLFEDEKHSTHERRVIAFGKTNNDKFLVVAFTFRKRFIRVISSRKMNRKERKIYEKA